MRNKNLSKIFWSFGLACAIIGIVFAGIMVGGVDEISKNPKSPGTIYVGGTGPNNYTTIQAGIDAASNGDTVFVYNGTYYENVVVGKTITLIGENRNTTIIDGYISGDLMGDIDWLSIKWFTIKNEQGSGISFSIPSVDNIAILQCNIYSNNGEGIYLMGSSNISVINCNISPDNGTGIYLFNCFNGTIVNNLISNATGMSNTDFGLVVGILLFDCSNIAVSNNVISNNSGGDYNYGGGAGSVTGISLHSSSNNSISNNIVSHNMGGNHSEGGGAGSVTGIELLLISNNNTILNNAILNNVGGDYNSGGGAGAVEGITIDGSDNVISGNTIADNVGGEGNSGGGAGWTEGITILLNSQNNLIFHNNLINNTRQAYDFCTNFWDNNYPSGGNYWSDYTGVDLYSGAGQNISGSDGIGDTPYNISGKTPPNQDRYPLMEPWNISVNQPPIVNITYPEDGQTVNGTVTITGTAYDSDTGRVHNLDKDTWYQTIQVAINDADAGNTIFVYSGTYYENVVVNKTLTLIGEDKNTVIIDGSGCGPVVHITANHVTMREFTIRNGGSESGIYLSLASFSKIENSVITLNGRAGIGFYKASHGLIANCTVIENDYGIAFWTALDNNITNCDIIHNLYMAITFSTANGVGSSGNYVTMCNVSDNQYGVSFAFSSNNWITNCVLQNNSRDGISLGSSSTNNSITNNRIANNSWYGIWLYTASNDNKIYLNNFISNVLDQARDECSNFWDNGSVGNYWNDYTGVDANSDGIGDTPYYIPGGSNQDNYPLMNPVNITLSKSSRMNDQSVVSTIPRQAASNGTTVQFVEIKIDSGSWQLATGTTSWSFDWDTTTVSNGWHTIYARAYDGVDYSEIKSVSVYVDNPTVNQPPIVNITYPIEGQAVTETVTITGFASDPDKIKNEVPNGTYVQKVEIKIDDGDWHLASGTTSWAFDWDTTTMSNGWHTIYARAFDGVNYSSVVSVEVYVDNPILKAVISSPEEGDTFFTTDSIYFDGANSTSIINPPPAYNWASNISGFIGNTSQFYASLPAGNHLITLWVSVGNCTDYVTVNITVIAPNQPPTAFIDSILPNPAIQGQSVSFVGHGDDFDGSVVDYYWYSNLNGFLSNQNSFSISNLSVGTHTISFKVMDDDGEWSDWDTEILVINLNVPPTVNITYPEDNQTVNGVITITGTASDSDGTVQKVEIKIDDEGWQTADGTASWSFVWNTTLVSDGMHIVYARSFDGIDYSDIKSVLVNVSNIVVNQPPVAGFIVFQGADVANGDWVNITLRVSGKKWQTLNMTVYADGDVVGNVSITRETGSPDNQSKTIGIMINSSKQYEIILSYTSNGKGASPTWLTVEYKSITDKTHFIFNADEGEEQNESVDLDMMLDMMIRSARMVMFDGSGSYDPDGSVVNYTWAFGDGCFGYGEVVVHAYGDYGTYTVKLSVMDGSGDTGFVSKEISVLDAAGDYAACMGVLGVELDCPADLLITDGYNRFIGYNAVNMSFENWVPNASMILFGDIEIYFIPVGGDYVYRVSGNGEGKYVFSVFSPGEYSPGEFGPGEFSPGEFAGKTYSVVSMVSSSTVDSLLVGDGVVSVNSSDDKYYSLYIRYGDELF
ncbi:MAG: NosD domain-containing protein, partial [Thermoplasmatales archaeon]|nr:NosD domain-containing protein [Thermoplasmatales archaeon]